MSRHLINTEKEKKDVQTIQRLVLKNFKRFKALELEFDPELNILVGGNEAGKSSVLQAIDIVLSASRSKVDGIGLEALFNADCIYEFLAGMRKITDLPELLIEVYFDDLPGRHDLDGRNNSKGTDYLGIKMVCKPVDEYTKEIQAKRYLELAKLLSIKVAVMTSTFCWLSVQPK